MQVSLENFSVTYNGKTWAVDNLSLLIPSGSLFGLIGPNGAGKSTTLRSIAGQCPPTLGKITLDGWAQDKEYRDRQQTIGFLGDQVPMYRSMTASQYLEFFARCHGLSRKDARERAHELLSELNLENKADVDCRALSKGMRQRLTIARTLVHRPKLLILDEPGDGLDPQGRVELRRLLRSIHERGTTLIISSHILRELDELCDRVAILQQGKIVMDGSVEDIMRDYAVGRNVYRIELLGSTKTEISPGLNQGAGQDTGRDEVFQRCRSLLSNEGCTIEAMARDADPPWIDVEIRGDDTEASRLLSQLVSAQIPLRGFSRQRCSLEDIYDSMSNNAVN